MKALVMLAVAVGTAAAGCGRECSATLKDGTYRIDYKTVGGTCGDFDSVLMRVVGGQGPADPNCTATYARRSEDNCSEESSSVCMYQAENLHATSTMVIEQKDDDGERYAGTMTITFRALDTRALECMGTYEATYTKL
jgi:hypothetical protein